MSPDGSPVSRSGIAPRHVRLRGRRLAWLALGVLGPLPRPARSQSVALSGQASAWVASKPDTAVISQTGLRYIPEVVLQRPLGGALGLTLDLSANGYVTGSFGQGQPARSDGTVKPYRAWARIATHTLEARIGLQKINFGSATLFRPLMWFDRVDPRDPLQLTDGVWGALVRYYRGNANVWGWALYGNVDPKGWEVLPTDSGSVEYGGRAQAPVPAGEVGVTFDHRRAYLSGFAPAGVVPEDRFGVDGKWNLGFGLWGEAALVHERAATAPVPYERFWSLGADYTVGVGNGLYVLGEYARIDAPDTPLGSGPGAGLSGLLLNYPVGLLDRVSAIVYHHWQRDEWYRILTWQRTYDAWSLYLLAFWNPAQLQALLPQQQSQSFAGRGLELMVTFNH